MEPSLETNGHDGEVNVRGEPAVHAHFLVTEVSAAIEAGIVHESVVDRPFQLPYVMVCDEDPRDVSRDQADGPGSWRWIRLRSRQVLEKFCGVRAIAMRLLHDA